MRTFKSIFGLIGALVPIVYCGYLLYYFLDLSGSVEEAKTDGLGPTLLGLGTVALLFCIPLILKIVRIFAGPRSGSGGRGGPEGSARDDEGGIDADAAIARYMAQRSAEAAARAPSMPPKPQGGGPARRPGFGRRIG